MKVKVKVALVVLLALAVALLSACSGRQPLDPEEKEAVRLARDYKAELNGVNLKIDKVDIVLSEGGNRERTLVIGYVTKAGDDREAFIEEIEKLITPAAQEKYGLPEIFIAATDDKGTLSKTVSIASEDVAEWVREKITWEEFVSRWIISGF